MGGEGFERPLVEAYGGKPMDVPMGERGGGSGSGADRKWALSWRRARHGRAVRAAAQP